jgi:hypothetical protein
MDSTLKKSMHFPNEIFSKILSYNDSSIEKKQRNHHTKVMLMFNKIHHIRTLLRSRSELEISRSNLICYELDIEYCNKEALIEQNCKIYWFICDYEDS